MLDPNDPAFPVPPPVLTINSELAYADPGISVRAHFAAMAMQGIMGSGSDRPHAHIARNAVAAADALIARLSR